MYNRLRRLSQGKLILGARGRGCPYLPQQLQAGEGEFRGWGGHTPRGVKSE